MSSTVTADREVRETRSELGYVPALDGLRALAVVGVMLYHGGLSTVPGGFLGVDLFFVLSGYLITTLLLAEHRRWGSVDLFAFWARRARRLLPALFLMLLAVAVYAATIAPEAQQRSIRGEGLATLLYVSNWWAILNDQSYFAQFLSPSPLAHTWSLAIEEQWYLVFPVVLIALLATRRPGRWLSGLLLGGAVASALWMAVLYDSGSDPSRVYFGTDTRVQDLFVGAALAAWLMARQERKGRAAPRGGRMLAASGWLALACVVVAMLTIPDDASAVYRGGFLLFSVVCAVLITAVLAPGGGWLSRILGWGPVRVVGLVSYGLYLWHWPVDVVLTPARTGLSNPSLLALRLGVTAALAAASYVLLERPIRRGALERSLGPAGAGYLAVASALAVAGALVLATPAASSAFADDGEGSGGTAGTGALRTYFVGDSVSYNLRFYFVPDEHPGIAVDGSARLGCGLIPKTNLVAGEPDPPAEGCAEWAAGWPAQVAEARPDLAVLFLGSWEQFDVLAADRTIAFGTPEYSAFLDAYLDGALQTLAASSQHVAIVNVPCHRVVEDGTNPIPTIVNDQTRVDWLNSYLAGYGSRSTTPFTLIDLNRFLCVDGDPVERDGIELRTDGLHFTPEGAGLVWEWLDPQLVAAMKD